MDPKEQIPEDHTNTIGVSDLSQLFAKVDPVVITQEQNTTTDPSSSTSSVGDDFDVHISNSTESQSPIGIDSTNQSMQSTFDPKLLASTLEDKWSDDAISTSQQLLQQQMNESSQSSSQTKPQIIEKIIYKKQRVHGFFRTLVLFALLFVGVLMLLESLKIFSLNIARLDMNIFYPVFIILSVIVIRSYKGLFGKIFGLLMFLCVVAGFFVVSVYTSLSSSIEHNRDSVISFPLSSGESYSKIYVSTLINSLVIGSKTGGDLLVSNYNIERPLLLLSGHLSGSHTYAIIQESSTINLLEGVYTHLNIGIQEQRPIYLYIKNLLGQHTLDMTNIFTRGLRLHGGIVSSNIIFGTGQDISSKSIPSIVYDQTLVVTGETLSGEISSGTDLFLSGVVPTIGSGSTKTISLDLEAAVADVTLHLPKTMGVRMQYKSYLGTTDLSQIIQKSDGTYESQNLDKATTVLDINALFGLSKFTIVRDR